MDSFQQVLDVITDVVQQNNSGNNQNITVSVDKELGALFISLSGLGFFVVSGILMWYSRGDDNIRGGKCNQGIIVFALLVTILADLSYQSSFKKMYLIYEMSKVILFGTVVTLCGAMVFFEIRQNNQIKSIGHHHGKISVFICAITIILLIFELFMFIGSFREKKPDYISACLILSGMLQKSFQAVLYYFFLRLKLPAKGKLIGASWYFKIISLFNFSMWLESIKIADMQGNEFIASIFQGGATLFSYGYAAFLIDYRLLCCIIFMENALKIDKVILNGEEMETQRSSSDILVLESVEIAEQFRVHADGITGLGYSCGITLCLLQLLNILVITEIFGPWANIFSIVGDVVVVTAGAAFLHLKRKASDDHIEKTDRNHLASARNTGEDKEKEIIEVEEEHVQGVDILMVGMGLFALAFWCLKCGMVSVWTVRCAQIKNWNDVHYFTWNAVKYGSRIISLIFQIYLFFKADVKSSCSVSMKRRKKSYFLVPLLMLSFLAVFLASIISFCNGKIEEKARSANLPILFQIVYTTGPPLHLGFCLHLFFHFLIINGKLKSPVVGRRPSRRHYKPIRRNSNIF
ncbi:uncharacterized protein LOC130636597 [Hydractinia symbiolongicarpus]|uniref:uncharacterized protein LOC130636597 n=1 Tax=Hydractinia symbiolongicarpus TaxID=13093 RepID=UPI00254D0CA3|nr:uncharacterized protein LOC130636597 [Hydractinia symbiolongicarpus]